MTKLPIPAAALSQHVILLGKTRSGKSSTMRLLVERLLDEQKPVCIIDPKGDWWGLKSSSTGKRAGYPVVIFGGDHADVPLNVHAAAHVAELVATGNRPCIIDLGGWLVSDRTKFFIAFASALFRKTRGPRYLVIDEVHNFAPQGKVLDPDAGKMLHWANRLASEGAGKGITLISASQRPQKVHKDYVTSHETLIAKRVIHPLDRNAVKEWIDGCGDPAMGKEVIGSMAGLSREEGWVWSPEIGFGPKLIKFPMFSTYDSFAAPTGEAVEALKGWATVDLEEVKSKLAAVVEEAKANDPRELRADLAKAKATIANLEKQMAAAVEKKVVTDPEAERKAVTDALLAAHVDVRRALEALNLRDLERGIKQAMQATDALTGFQDIFDRVSLAVTGPIENLATGKTPIKFLEKRVGSARLKSAYPAGSGRLADKKAPPAAPIVRPVQASAPRPLDDGEVKPLGAERRPLAVLVSVHPAGMTEAQWALGTGLKRKGGTWGTYVSRLRTAGRIEKRGDLFYATEQGIADVGGSVEPMPPPGDLLVDYWASKIPGAAPMLRCLAGFYPNWLTREDLADQLNLAAGGGTFGTYLSRLRAPGLIEEDGEKRVRAHPDLMGDAARGSEAA